MNLLNTMICWIPDTDDVFLHPWPDNRDDLGRKEKETGKHYMTGGACYTAIHKMSFEKRKMHVFIEAIHMIVRDECDPIAVHKALLGLDEYNDGLAADVPGVNLEIQRQ